MSLKEKINANPKLKSFIHWMLIAPGEASSAFMGKMVFKSVLFTNVVKAQRLEDIHAWMYCHSTNSV